MTTLLTAAVLSGVMLQAPTTCSITGVASIQPVSGTLALIQRQGRGCTLHVTADSAVSNVEFTIVFPDSIHAEPTPLSSGVTISTVADAAATVRRVSVNVVPGEPRQFAIATRHGDSTSVVQGEVTIMPRIRIQPSTTDCGLLTLCLNSGSLTQISIVGLHLGQIAGDHATISTGAFTLAVPFERVATHLTLHVPASHGLDPAKRYRIAFALRHPALDKGLLVDSVSIQSVGVTVPPKPKVTVSLRAEGQSRSVFFVSEQRDVTLQVTDATIPADTYQLFEPGTQDPTGLLLIRQDGTGSVVILKPTSVLSGTVPMELEGRRSASGPLVFNTTLAAMSRPAVTAPARMVFPEAGYTTSTLRPGVTAVITLTGKNVSQFTPDVAPEYRDEFEHIRSPGLPDEMRVRIRPKSSLRSGEIPLLLSVPGTSLDTVVMLTLKPNQRPRPLDFIDLHYRGADFVPLLECVRTKPVKVKLSYAAGETSACNLSDISLTFHSDSVDTSTDLYGPQYLEVQASIRDPKGVELKRDTIKWVVAPAGYVVAPGYRSGRSISLSELIDNYGRYARPGSAVTVTVRHEQAQYESQGATTVRSYAVRDQRRWSVNGYAGISTGLAYAAQVRDVNRTQAPLLNGSPQDSLIRTRIGEKWQQGLIAAALSAAIDIRSYYSDGHTTPVRIRLGMFLMDSPYTSDTDNRPALAILYPLEIYSLNGAVEFSLHGGVVAMAGEKPFPVLGLGVGFSTAAGGNK